MKARLLSPGSDFDWQWALKAAAARNAADNGWRYQDSDFDWYTGFPWNWGALAADLELDPLLKAMAREDGLVYEVSRRVLFGGTSGDRETIHYRQHILQDALENPAAVRELYSIALSAKQREKKHYLGISAKYPSSVTRESVSLISELLDLLQSLHSIALAQKPNFKSAGWQALFETLVQNLGREYLDDVRRHLKEIRSQGSLMLLSANLGRANKGRDYKLHVVPPRGPTWWTEIRHFFRHDRSSFGFSVHPRDDAGIKAIQALEENGHRLVAQAVGQAAEHLRSFFSMLGAELAFYVGCINLSETLGAKKQPFCMPDPVPTEVTALSYRDLYDVGLALTTDRPVIGNDADADGKDLLVMTGANSGGKSTLLRALGIAQLMMQAGMFVPASAFRASLCDGLFTHFKREEDTTMESGKFDEELDRMSEIVDHLTPRSLVLFNEPFASTNEREGSEIARQIIAPLRERGIRCYLVTHLYELARRYHAGGNGRALFLRAVPAPDGTRTFKLTLGEPLPTSYGEDVYRRIFERGPEIEPLPAMPSPAEVLHEL